MSSLAGKLQIKPNQRWLFIHAPQNYAAQLDPLPEGVSLAYEWSGGADGIQLFVKNSAELMDELRLLGEIKPDTILWVTYPKKASGIETDLGMTADWGFLAPFGLRPVASASVDEKWTALRLKPEDKTNPSEFSNREVQKNAFGEFIDVVNRRITLPPDMQQAMQAENSAGDFFWSLSFTNQKEYVVWILSAKQEKTKNERLAKLADKLLAGRKNPSEK